MEREKLLAAFEKVRLTSEELCSPLQTEDYVVQTTTDVSPPKWNLAHTSWFFERVIVHQFTKNYRPYHPQYYYLFNSYYQSLGERWQRDARGAVSRPTVKEIYDYRRKINERMRSLISDVSAKDYAEVARLTELGLHHEQQHQELLVTDIKHIFATNPLRPVYADPPATTALPPAADPARFVPIGGGIWKVGSSNGRFSWDNERPEHEVILSDFSIMDRLVTCGEFLEFMAEGGYRDPLLWLSDGWDAVQAGNWHAPLYWEEKEGAWNLGTLTGFRTVDPGEPVCHISYYEADAYARWKGKRLPLETEWEKAASLVRTEPSCGNFLETKFFHPVALGFAPGTNTGGLSQMFGDVWEWTGSAYLPYPGYRPEAGPLGEYNGKFMNNQMVLRGGSCATPGNHIRPTYRNFFQGDKRWQFSGIRLASDGV